MKAQNTTIKNIMEEFRIDYFPVTDLILGAWISENGDCGLINVDLSDDATKAVARQLINRGENVIFKYEGREYMLKVEKVSDIPNKYGLVKSELKEGDQLVCWEPGSGYGDTFTVKEDHGLGLQWDNAGTSVKLEDVDLSNYAYKD